jgi:hypothetical protein
VAVLVGGRDGRVRAPPGTRPGNTRIHVPPLTEPVPARGRRSTRR